MRIHRGSTAHRVLRYLAEQGPSPADLVGGHVWTVRTGPVCSHSGGGDYAAQMLLGRLKKAGLVRHAHSEGASLWEITTNGRKVIAHDLAPSARPNGKTFERGQAVEIQREPGTPWEPATYHAQAETGRRGWHCVELIDESRPHVVSLGSREFHIRKLTIPTRRIRRDAGPDPTDGAPAC